MKSFKQFLFESEAVSTGTSVNSNTSTNNASVYSKPAVVNTISPPMPAEDPRPNPLDDLIGRWSEEWERNNPMPKPRDGESTEDYEERLDEWQRQYELWLEEKIREWEQEQYEHGTWEWDRGPIEPGSPDPTPTEVGAWELLRDIGLPGPWQDQESWEFLRDLDIPGPWQYYGPGNNPIV